MGRSRPRVVAWVEVGAVVGTLTGVPVASMTMAGHPMAVILWPLWLIWLQVAWAVGWELTVSGPRAADRRPARPPPLTARPLAALTARAVSTLVTVGVLAAPVGPAPEPADATTAPTATPTASSGLAAADGGTTIRDLAAPASAAVGGAMLAVGVVQLLRRRRRYHRAHRRPGGAPPAPPADLDALERVLLAAARPDEAGWWRAATRSFVADRTGPAQGPTPVAFRSVGTRLVAFTVGPDGTHPPPPWAPEAAGGWSLPTATPTDHLPTPDDPVDPLPAIVMVADDVAIDLQAIGGLAVTGPSIDVADTVRALVRQLRFSPVTGAVELRMTTGAARLVGDVDRPPTPAGELVAELAAPLAARRGADTTGDPAPTAPDVPPGPPVVVVLTGHEAPRLQPVLATARSGPARVAVVVAGAAPAGLEWVLSLDTEPARLAPLDLELHPSRLGAGTATALDRLVDDAAAGPRPLPVVDGLTRSVLPAPTAVASPALDAPSSHPGAGRAVDDLPATRAAPHPVGGEQGPMVRVLGPVGVDGLDVDLTPQQLSLLACLACTGPATRAELVEAMWDGRPVSAGRFSNLLAEVRARIGRQHLPDARDGRYELAGIDLDLAVLEAAVGPDPIADDPASLHRLDTALELVRGTPFTTPGSRYWSWVDHQAHLAARVETLVAEAARRSAELHLRTGDLHRALRACEIGLSATPLDEALVVVSTDVHLLLGRVGAAHRLVVSWEDGIRSLACGEPSAEPRRRLIAARRPVVGPRRQATVGAPEGRPSTRP